MGSKDSCRTELRIAIRQLSDRCLYSASKWAAEQLVGIEEDPAKFTPSNTRFQRGSSRICRKSRTHETAAVITPVVGVLYDATPVNVMEKDELAGEKQKEEETIELGGPLGKSDAINHELVSLERELSTIRKNGKVDPFCLYLYGLVLKQKGNENLACTVLVESVNYYPWNWNAWTKLQSLCKKVDILNSLNLNSHWMKDFFLASVYQELRMHNDSLSKYEYLLGTFGYSNYLQAQIAKVQYSLREFAAAD
ncbi:Anaphase-promoting complex subunit 8 [Glycine soja]|nr:Anaphase-promoting complex subunit 8 [Glycine soja]